MGASATEKLQGTAAQFCATKDDKNFLTIYRTLKEEWGETTDIRESELYDKLKKAEFTPKMGGKDDIPTQISLWAGDINSRLGKCPSYVPNKATRDNLVLDRLLNGMPKAYADPCSSMRSSETRVTWRFAVKRLQDWHVSQTKDPKSEISTKTYLTTADAAKIKAEAKAEARKEMQQESYYTGNQQFSGGWQKGGWNGGKNKGGNSGNWNNKGNWGNGGWQNNGGWHNNTPYGKQNSAPSNNKNGNGGNKNNNNKNNNTKGGGKGKWGGKGVGQENVILQCSFCKGYGHESAYCWQKGGQKGGKQVVQR